MNLKTQLSKFLEHQGKNVWLANVIHISKNPKQKTLSYFNVMQDKESIARERKRSLQVFPTAEFDELLFEFEVDDHGEIILE